MDSPPWREVQDDLGRPAPSNYPVTMDVTDGEFVRLHSLFKNHDFLKIELNSDDFLHGVTKLCSTGIRVMINGVEKVYYGALFFTVGDYLAQQQFHGRKESVSVKRLCPCCDVSSDNYIDSIDQVPSPYSIEQYEQACTIIESMTTANNPSTLEFWRKFYGINVRSIFYNSLNFDPTIQVLFDPMHVLLQRVCKFHLNVFLDYCRRNNVFTIDEFCHEVNTFEYDINESSYKPHLSIKLEDVAAQIGGDELHADIDAWGLSPETTHTAKTCKINEICYSIGTVLCTSSQYLTHAPQLAQIVYIFIIGDNTVFGIRFLKTVNYDEYLRAFKVQGRERFGTMAAADLKYVWSLKNG
ncbi:unnamed protein product [Didymodactylos carnosus]|uniref:Uncharacterized protein n=1 Tax=Didymodactylos carnosus TaxID=1234261 RepID=A0A815VAL4_9BILA|nr:unnamed protein product [Didymodactylos carnosus]CAF4384594.1 unnamed protein product [Didymodactylos carnosus]